MKIDKLKSLQNPIRVVAAASLGLFLVSGCVDKTPIQFSDEHMATLGVRKESPGTAPGNSEHTKLDKQDLYKVELAVYREMLLHPLWDAGNYSAIFLQGGDDEVAALINAFPNHNPPLKESSKADVRPKQAPLDKESGRPAIILSVETREPVDNTVQAAGKWYAGDAVSGSHEFTLRKSGDDWSIETAK